MNRIFKKAAKGKRGAKKAQERLDRTFEEKRALEDLLFFLGEAPDMTELERLVLETPFGPWPQPKSPRKGEVASPSESGLFREMRTWTGRLILVGKSAKGNDFLLRRKARKGDLWFHVKDFAGAHVILRRERDDAATIEDMQFAAGIAVHFSKARGKGKIEVIVADVADVGRAKGALPGQVTVKAYRTVVSEGLSDEQLNGMI